MQEFIYFIVGEAETFTPQVIVSLIVFSLTLEMIGGCIFSAFSATGMTARR